MKDDISGFVKRYKANPGWYWLIATVLLFPILPEYVSPFILFIGFIVFKVQWSREGKKAKVGTLGKMMMAFMTLALVSTLWSETKFSTLSTAALWWGMFLVEVMIFNLATTRKKIDRILSAMVLAGAANGLVGSIQMLTYVLYKLKKIKKAYVLTTPFYRKLDYIVYTKLPFEITTKAWASRASGFFSNPNLLATYMVICYPISIYLFLNTKNKKHKVAYFISNVLISAGMSSTMTRAGCFIAIAGWIFMFVILAKRHWRELLEIFIPTTCIIVPSILTRYGIIFKTFAKLNNSGKGGAEAKESSQAHLKIWKSLFDYITTHVKALIYGTGFGVEQTGHILAFDYALKKPHAHNFLIETWVELGVIGVILLAAIIVCNFGKLLEINTNNGKKFTLVFCVFTATMLYLLFGLTDYIFNSPKQIIFLFIMLGLTQAISRVYDKTLIHDTSSLVKVAENEIQNILHQ